MKLRHGTAGDGDEKEREEVARPDRSGPVDEARDGRHLEVGSDEQDAEGEADDGADLEEGRQIVAGASTSQTGSVAATKP